jgi:hypothetical protein
MAEAYVVAAGEVAGKFLIAEDGDDSPSRMGYERHARFDQDVGPSLEPTLAVTVPSGDVLVRCEERDDGLDLAQCRRVPRR